MAVSGRFILCALVLLCVPQAFAATTAKSKPKPVIAHTLAFDGTYSGLMTPTPALSDATCPVIMVQGFVINGGVVKPLSAAASLQPSFDGFVTDAGFITGHMHLVDTVAGFEGRAERQGLATVISAGVVDDKSHCTWVVNLTIE